jgi:hypothetical protein
MPAALVAVVTAVALGVALLLPAGPATASVLPSAEAALPSKARWEADVRAVMAGSTTHLARRARRARANGFPVRRLAINLDIDNTSLATRYDRGRPVEPTLRYVRAARRLGIKVFFNTARPRSWRRGTVRSLRRAGFPVDRLCMARRGEGTVHSKQRCRRAFAADGFRLVGNVGNRRTDFAGRGYERAYRLPDYRGQLA